MLVIAWLEGKGAKIYRGLNHTAPYVTQPHSQTCPGEGLPLCHAGVGGSVSIPFPGRPSPSMINLFTPSMEKQTGVIQGPAGVGAVGLSVQALIPISYKPQIIHKVCKSDPNE